MRNFVVIFSVIIALIFGAYYFKKSNVEEKPVIQQQEKEIKPESNEPDVEKAIPEIKSEPKKVEPKHRKYLFPNLFNRKS